MEEVVGAGRRYRVCGGNSAYEVGFCCKQKKSFAVKKKRGEEKVNSSNLGKRKTRESVATLGNFSHLSTTETYS